MSTASDSLVEVESAPECRSAVVCIPQGAAGAASLVSLARSFRGSASVWIARFPGRESRILEPPLTSIEEMASSLLPAALRIEAENIVFFGHCSGALVAYELAHMLSREACAWPNAWLALSGQAPPIISQGPDEVIPRSQLGLIEKLRANGGTPEDVLADAEFLEMLAPMIEADFDAWDRYRAPEGRGKLAISISVLGGKADETVCEADLLAWQDHTTGQFRCDLLDGDHFFLTEQENTVGEILMDLLSLR